MPYVCLLSGLSWSGQPPCAKWHATCVLSLSKCVGDSAGPGPLWVWIWAVESGVCVNKLSVGFLDVGTNTQGHQCTWLWTHLGVWLAPSLMSVTKFHNISFPSDVRNTRSANTPINDCRTLITSVICKVMDTKPNLKVMTINKKSHKFCECLNHHSQILVSGYIRFVFIASPVSTDEPFYTCTSPSGVQTAGPMFA